MARLHLRLGMLLVLIMFMSGCIYSSTPEWGTEDGQVHVKIDGDTAKVQSKLGEGFDETVSFETLENAEWSEKRLNAQSMVDGYWVRFAVKNNLQTDKIGLSHNFNYEKKIFIKNSLGIDEFRYWKAGINKNFEETHIGSEFRIHVPKNRKTTIYNFFRNYPVDRFNSMDNYHRMMIGSWESLRNK